ncbi:hypothetical protein N3K66_007904 [Trichothecium roseum]|uniref:Uncharacterized protein n=1 Tax=Trichothecium roseum TaxID=47278 RepID=A0ACC0UUH3_9HYPO|nr:hypothetical protein N3K66_007904 [Trichothecium roseum]
MDSKWWEAPEGEENRIWHKPEVMLYTLSHYPETSSYAQIYDIAHRSCYRANFDTVVTDEEWMENLVTKQVTEYQAKHGTNPDFNVINTTREGTLVTFEKKPYSEVAHSIKGNVHYGQGPDDVFPTTTYDELLRKTYMTCGSDRCVWQGVECVFKRIEMVEDLNAIRREIEYRQALVAAMSSSSSSELHSTSDDRYTTTTTMEEKFNVLGILLPYGGEIVENLAGGYEYGMCRALKGEKPPPKPWPSIPVSEEQILVLVRGVREIARAGVVHGDVADQNTLVAPDGRLVLSERSRLTTSAMRTRSET